MLHRYGALPLWLIAASLSAGTVAETGGQPQAEHELPASVLEFIGEAGRIVDVWTMNEHLVGITLETAPGDGMTIFMDASGEFLVSGAVVEVGSGRNIAEERTRQRFPVPGPREMYAEAKDLNWVRTGQPGLGEPIYIVADTQCGYCHEVAKSLARHGIQREIRWVMVGFLGPKSMNQAAGITVLPPEDAGRALWAVLTGAADGEPENVDPLAQRAIVTNNRWAERWRIQGTPVMLLPHEGQIHKIVGLPQASLWSIIDPP